MWWKALLVLALGVAVSGAVDGSAVRALRFQAADTAGARQWQERARSKLYALMMGGAMPGRVPLDVRVVHREEHPEGGFALEQITIQTLPDRRVHAWVAMPLNARGKVPALLALHGHYGKGEEAVRGQSLYWYGRTMAEMGYAVIAPEIGSHDLQHSDWCLMGERTWDAIRCIDYILTRPEVDGRGVAAAGLSLGGETAMYVAALDDRVLAVDSSGWLTTVGNMKNGHCPCWNFAGLEENFDFSDIFALIAPRPLICEIGEREKAPGGFPQDVARAAFEEVRAAYRVFGADSRAVLDVHPEGHVFIGREFWEPLRQTLGTPDPWSPRSDAASEALRRAEIARRCFSRALKLLDGWWALRDCETDLFPRTVDQNVWSPSDNAADMLPFLYLTAHFLAPERREEIARAFRSERMLTNRVSVLPDWYDIAKRGWTHEQVDMARLTFCAAEYCKDGLLPMTEVMGRGPWTERMQEQIQAVFENASVPSDFGMLPADDTEVNGELLQVLCRLYHMTGERRYLDWAERIGDAYCLEILPANGLPAYRWDFREHKPIRDILSLNDHGNEIIGGLSELMVASSAAGSSKAPAYREALRMMYARLLERGRNADGVWFSLLKASTGDAEETRPPDTWGYALTGVATFAMAAGDGACAAAPVKALRNIESPSYLWWNGADSYADSIEGALLLLNRHPAPEGFRWLERELPIFLAFQKETGVVEGWYGDGNYARTALMAGLYYTQGVVPRPWREDLQVGAVQDSEGVSVVVRAAEDWDGRLVFDTPRHRTVLRLPMNYPRLNEFPEWFTVRPEAMYAVSVGGRERTLSGADLARGVALKAAAGRVVQVRITPAR